MFWLKTMVKEYPMIFLGKLLVECIENYDSITHIAVTADIVDTILIRLKDNIIIYSHNLKYKYRTILQLNLQVSTPIQKTLLISFPENFKYLKYRIRDNISYS